MRADEQTAGHGRRGRRWLAAPGSALLASVVLRPRARPPSWRRSLVGGLAVCDAARALGAPALVEWPNDVVVGGRKLAGVLAELVPGAVVVLGLGVNLASKEGDLPPADRLIPTSLLLETGSAPSAPTALAALLEALRPLAAAFDQEGPPAISAHARPLDALAAARYGCAWQAA